MKNLQTPVLICQLTGKDISLFRTDYQFPEGTDFDQNRSKILLEVELKIFQVTKFSQNSDRLFPAGKRL